MLTGCETPPASVPAAAPTRTQAEPAAATPGTGAPIGIVLDRSHMLIFGWLQTAAPERAIARFAGAPAVAGQWQALTWRQPDASCRGVPFVGAVFLDNVLRAQATAIELEDASGSIVSIPVLGHVELDHQELLDHVSLAAASASQVFDFLRETLFSEPFGGSSENNKNFLRAFLSAISQQDGFIEILGVPSYGGLFIQGWSVHLRPGFRDVGIFADGFDINEMAFATFERSDLLDAAKGVVGYAKSAHLRDLDAVKAVHFKCGANYFHLDVVHDNRIALGAEDTVAHLKNTIPTLAGERSVLGAFKRVCRPKFPGTETVSTFPGPVAVACDLALMLPDDGIFLSGWLLDPADMVMLSILKSTSNMYVQLQSKWARHPRPDVGDGYASDPRFAPHMSHADPYHGFMAFVPRAEFGSSGEEFYLEIVLKDEQCLFLPIAFSNVEPATELRRLLGGLRTDDPALDTVIERHLGPTVSSLAGRRSAAAPASDPIPLGRRAKEPKVSVIMPLTGGCSDLDVNFATFAGDADLAQAEFIVVAPRAGSENLKSLKQQVAFYGLDVSLVLTREALDPYDAVQLGAQSAHAELMLFLSPSVLPRHRGWLSALCRDLEHTREPAPISPTLIYEDGSILHAGQPLSAGPAALVQESALSGQSTRSVLGMTTRPAATVDIRCCLIPRALFSELGGFTRKLVEPDYKNADFSLSVRKAGRRCYWSPKVVMYAADDDNAAAPAEYWHEVAKLVDRWTFERRWSWLDTSFDPSA
jgi:hypothetical protein